MYLEKNDIKITPEIGRRFANRDHTTVIHAENYYKTIWTGWWNEKHWPDKSLLLEQWSNAIRSKERYFFKVFKFCTGNSWKKNTLPILSNVLLQLKNNKLLIVATDLDIIFYDEISDVKIINEGSTTTSAAILYDILRKISSNSELNFNLKSENKLIKKWKFWF